MWRTPSSSGGTNCVEVWVTASSSGGGNCVEVGWDKSSHSNLNGACVEVGTGMHKATASIKADGCVEAGPCACGGDVLVRDTKNRDGGTLAFSREAWMEFTEAIKADLFTG